MEEKSSNSIIEERKNKLKDVFWKKNIIMYIGLLILILLAWHIRTSNVPLLKDVTTGNHTLGPDLDPFLFLRYAETIVDNGSLPKIDYMRNVPVGFNTAIETMLLPQMMAYFHKILAFFSLSDSVVYSSLMFPAFIFIITVVVFFLFVRKIFDGGKYNKYKDLIAFIAAFFLIVSPTLLSRTIAGIPEKESVGFLFLFLSFYFFLYAWKSDTTKKSLVLGSLAGISTGTLGLLWGGWVYVFTSVSVAVLLAFIFGKVRRREFYLYSLWLFFSIAIPILFSQRYTLKQLIYSTSSGSSFLVFLIILIDLLIFSTQIKNLNFIEKLRKKFPDKAISLGIFIVFVLVVSSIVFGIGFVPEFMGKILFQLRQPYADRLSFTVAENRQPHFDEWRDTFGPIVRNIPLSFWLFFVGSIVLFYDALKPLGRKKKAILVSSYVLFIFALIFSRNSETGLLNGTNNLSLIIYFGGFIVFLAGIGYVYYLYDKEKNLDELKKINFSYLFVLSYFIISLIGARSAIRLVMALVPAAGILVGYFTVMIVIMAVKSKDEIKKLVLGIIAVIVVVAMLYTAWTYYQATDFTAKNFAPNAYNQQWQKAMAWVRENTTKPEITEDRYIGPVFAHWWDYGYWIQAIGERATVLDGGNAINYWNHLIARHVLTADNEQEALEFLYTHDVTHFLIDSTDIGKYPAYSNIGSDENYDRYSWVPTFLLNDKYTQELKNETIIYYEGGFNLDEDFVYEKDGEKIFFPAGSSGIGAIKLTLTQDGEIKDPEIILVYKNQYNIPLNCVYYNNEAHIYDDTGYDGCLYLIPKFDGSTMNLIGAGIFAGERVRKTLLFKLYLLGEGENFKLVHNEQDFVVENLKEQNAMPQEQDFVYYQGVRGPIKIWEVNYPSNIEIKPEYLETDFPDQKLNIVS